MTSQPTSRTTRSVRRSGASLLVASVIALFGVLVAPAPATAADFAIDAPASGALFTGALELSGTKDATARVEVPSLTGGDPYCIIAAGSESWSCTGITLPDGEWTLTATQYPAAGDPVSATVTVRVLGAPVIDSPALTTGLVSGKGHPGAGITIVGSGPQDPSGPCTIVQSSGFWSCPLPVSASGQYSIAATQTWPGSGEPGGTSASREFTIDKDAPGLAVIAAPSPGQRFDGGTIAFSGSGEEGGRVDVFLDGVPVCSARVAGAAWSCSAGGVAPGDHGVQAIQWDAAGNPGGATPAFTITVVGPQPPPPSQRSTPAPAPPQPPAEPPPPADPPPSPTPTPSPSQGIPFFPPPIGGDSGLPPGATWGTPTDYGAAIPAASTAPWLTGAAVGLGFIALVALPSRLLAKSLVGRVTLPRRRDAVEPPLLGPWATAAMALGAAILLTALAGGIQAEVRYLRLMVAIGVALVAVNGVGVALATKFAGRALGSSTGIRIAPLLLGIGAVSALLSRTGGVQPPVIVGVVIAATFAADLPARSRGIVALAELAALTALGAAGWLMHSALGPVEGFWASLASETFGALCIAALGSAVVLVLPIGRMPGRTLFDWSRPAWVAVAVPAAVLAGVVVGGGKAFPIVWAAGIALVFAALCLAAFAWTRYVEPQVLARG